MEVGEKIIPLMTVKDVAAMLGISQSTAYELVIHHMEYLDLNKGCGKNRCIRIAPEAFEAYMASCSRRGRPPKKQSFKQPIATKNDNKKLHIPRWNEIHSNKERSE